MILNLNSFLLLILEFLKNILSKLVDSIVANTNLCYSHSKDKRYDLKLHSRLNLWGILEAYNLII